MTFDPACQKSEDEARLLIQRLFARLSDWMTNHHLKLNTDKTVILPVTRDHSRTFEPVVVGTYSVPPSLRVRNLGFIFNRSLTIVDHVAHIRRSTFYQLRRITSLKHCVSFNQLELLVHSFITSRVDFCSSLFYGSTSDSLKGLKSVLSSSARVLTGANRRCMITPIFIKLHWLPLEARILYKLATFGFKITQQQTPKYLLSHIYLNIPIRSTRSASAPVLSSLSFKSTSRLVKYGDRSCFFSICEVFNSLPAEIRGSLNLNIFKQHLKKYLFIRYYTA